MIGAANERRSRAAMARIFFRFAPDASARWPAAWMTGPSAVGSENGTPSSRRSRPLASADRMFRSDVFRSGSPAVR